MRTEVDSQRDCRPHRSLTFYERKDERFNHLVLNYFPCHVRSPDSAFRNSTMSDSSCLVSFRGLILVDSHLFLCPPFL